MNTEQCSRTDNKSIAHMRRNRNGHGQLLAGLLDSSGLQHDRVERNILKAPAESSLDEKAKKAGKGSLMQFLRNDLSLQDDTSNDRPTP